MSFCSNCGVKIESENSKFCSNCGFSFEVKKDVNESPKIQERIEPSSIESATASLVDEEETEESEYTAKNAYSLGFQFEDTVEAILKAKGYATQRRLRLDGKNGKSEIDIVAIKKFKGKENCSGM